MKQIKHTNFTLQNPFKHMNISNLTINPYGLYTLPIFTVIVTAPHDILYFPNPILVSSQTKWGLYSYKCEE